jgi:lysophospholipase L1-like esterase
LSACGGGGGGSAPAASAKEVAPIPLTHVTVYLDQDSTGWGVNPNNTSNMQQAPGVGNGIVGRANPSPAQLMQADFDKALGVGVVTVIDGSIPGATIQSDLNGTAPSIAPLATRLAQLGISDVVVIPNFEINDQYVLKESPQTYAAWEQQLAQTIKAAGDIAVFAEPNPICEPGFDIPTTDEFVAQTRQLATTQGITLLPTYDVYKLYPLWNTTLQSDDCVHPNDAGYAFKEANYFPALLPVIKAKLGR